MRGVLNKRNYLPLNGDKALLLGALFIASALQLMGLGALAIIISCIFITFVMSFPTQSSTFFARFVISFLMYIVIVQIITAFIGVLDMNAGFAVVGVLASLATGLLALLLRSEQGIHKYSRKNIFSKYDAAGLLGALTYFVPIALFASFASAGMLQYVGGIQGIDGVNHYSAITSLSKFEYLDYTKGIGFFPKSMHVATAFIQSNFGLNQGEMAWISQARNYFMQYAFFGAGFLLVLYYFTLALAGAIGGKILSLKGAIALSLLVVFPVTLFYLPIFINSGFLSFFYIIASIMAGALYLLDARIDKWHSLFGYLLLTLGASFNWPLLTPAILLTAGFMYIKLNGGLINRYYLSRHFILCVALAFLHFIPIYFQLKYSTTEGQGISQTGGLHVLNVGVLALGIGALAYVHLSLAKDQAKRVGILLLPLTTFLFLLICIQLFTVGEIRYYAIKTSILVEIMLISLLGAVIAKKISLFISQPGPYLLLAAPIFMGAILTLCLLITGINPFGDLRDLLRGYSGVAHPSHYVVDSKKLSDLGASGKITKSNALSLHINQEGVYFMHPQAFYWANVMSYKGSVSDYKALSCSMEVYTNMFVQNFGPVAQNELLRTIYKCAEISKASGAEYYVITDDTSKNHIVRLIGDKSSIR